jgi:membrane associated rhomboid family serine protease
MSPWVIRLIIANALVFILQQLRPGLTGMFAFIPAFALMQPWTVITYMFLHGDFMHILFNMLGLLFFGPRVEMRLGGKHFLGLYVTSGLAGALLSFINPGTAIIGASAGVFGVFLAFAYFWPREPIYIWGVLPVQARWMVVGMTVLSLAGGLGFAADGVAHFAHLGGYLGGFVYLKLLERRTQAAATFTRITAPVIHSGDIDRWRSIPRESLHEVNRAEYDRIMEKLAASGVGNLTETEKAFLERFSAR